MSSDLFDDINPYRCHASTSVIIATRNFAPYSKDSRKDASSIVVTIALLFHRLIRCTNRIFLNRTMSDIKFKYVVAYDHNVGRIMICCTKKCLVP